MSESKCTVNTLHCGFSALLTWLQQLQQRCQEDNKHTYIKCIPREGTSIKTKRELEETGLRSSEGVKVTSYNPHLAHTHAVEGDQHQPDTVSNNLIPSAPTWYHQQQPDTISTNVACTQAISTALCVLFHVPVQVAYIPITTHIYSAVFYFPRHWLTNFCLSSTSVILCLLLKRINAPLQYSLQHVYADTNTVSATKYWKCIAGIKPSGEADRLNLRTVMVFVPLCFDKSVLIYILSLSKIFYYIIILL
jgi:hypothetical protein